MKKRERTSKSGSEADNAALHAPEIRRLLLAAYDLGKRTLPWRGETDPYRIWVSEVMLQQTRVDTVIPYYQRWLERFPDVDALAEADGDEVLRVWQGLGYYSRARRLHEGAKVVRERFGGALPANSEALRELPGVGEYTAGAVASIAYGEAVPAVDGNVKRVLSRLFDLPAPTPSEYQSIAFELVDPHRPGDFNQALMELGALVCLPCSPRCGDCPVRSGCLALERGTVSERPAGKMKKAVPEVDIAVLVAAAPDQEGELRFLLRKRPDSGLLAGMWEFPGVENASGADAVVDLASQLLLPGSQLTTPHPISLRTVTHLFSHLKARYHPALLLMSMAAAPEQSASDHPSPRWLSFSEIDEVPLPVAQGKIARLAVEASATKGEGKRKPTPGEVATNPEDCRETEGERPGTGEW